MCLSFIVKNGIELVPLYRCTFVVSLIWEHGQFIPRECSWGAASSCADHIKTHQATWPPFAPRAAAATVPKHLAEINYTAATLITTGCLCASVSRPCAVALQVDRVAHGKAVTSSISESNMTHPLKVETKRYDEQSAHSLRPGLAIYCAVDLAMLPFVDASWGCHGTPPTDKSAILPLGSRSLPSERTRRS